MDAPMQKIPLPTRPTRRRRRRLCSVTAVAGLSVLVSQCAPQQCGPAPTPAPAPAGSVAQQVVDLVNRERAAVGVGPVSLHPALTSAAQAHSNYQASVNTMTHYSGSGANGGQRIAAAGYAWRAWAENIAAGQQDAASAMSAWMGSTEGHKENILNPRYTDIGVGLAYSANGTPYWTQDFASG
jgi:uncharacterized protein YkwD